MMRAIVMAGGKGRRLRPFTAVIPKPLAPLGDRSILEIVLRQLKRDGVERVTLAVGYQAELIMAVIGDGSKFGLEIDYSFEQMPLGTIGPLAQIPDLNETFLVMNGDILTDLRYDELVTFHKERGGIATIAAHQEVEEISLGVLECDSAGRLVGFHEKPRFQYTVSMGIYVFEPQVLEFITPGTSMGLDRLMARLLEADLAVYTYPFNGYWIDIGRFEDFGVATELFEKHKARFLAGAM